MKKISIVVPTLNEAENIDVLIPSIFEHCGHGDDVEVIVVDDGSTDGTRHRVEEWAKKRPVRLLARDNQRGLTGAVLDGAAIAQGDIVLVMDADLSHPTQTIPALLAPILEDKADMVIASRYIPGGGSEGWPLKRVIMSRGAALMSWPLTDIKDPLAGFFAVRKEKMLAVGASGREGFKISLEIMMHWRETLRVCETPIIFKDRTHGKSKLGTKVMMHYLARLAALSGGVFSTGLFGRFITAGVLGGALNVLAIWAMLTAGLSLAMSQVGGAIAAAMLMFPMFAAWVFRAGSGRAAQFGKYSLLTVAMTMFQGVFISAADVLTGCGPVIAAAVSIPILLVLNYFGMAFYAFSPTMAVLPRSGRWVSASIGVVVFLFMLRLLMMPAYNLLPEEAYYWNYSQHPALGYLDHPPMVAWLITVGEEIFGHNEFGVRFGALISWCVAAGFVFASARRLFDKPTALRAVLLMAALPYFFFTGLIMTPDAPLVACWAGAVYFLQRALLDGRPAAWYGAGICIGLGMLSKYTICLLGGAALAFLIIDPASRRWLARPQPYVAILLAAILFSPVLIWNYQNGWASFLFHSSNRWDEGIQFSPHILLGWIALLITPIGLLAAVHYLFRRNPALPDYWPADSRRRNRIFLMLFTLVPLAVFVYSSFKHEPRLNWAGPLWLAMLPWIAYGIAPAGQIKTDASDRALQKSWAPMVAITLLVFAVISQYLTIGLPFAGYLPDNRLAGWREFSQKVAATCDAIRQSTGNNPVIVAMDKYQTTSEFAFYVPKYSKFPMPTGDFAGWNLFEYNAQMYNQWAMPSSYEGRTVLIVAYEKRYIPQRNMEYFFVSPVAPMAEDRVRLNEATAMEYYWQAWEDYKFVELTKLGATSKPVLPRGNVGE